MTANRLALHRDDRPRIVISGLGVASPIGNSLEAFWESLAAGRSGIVAAPHLSSEAFPQVCAGLATGFTGDVRDFPEMADDEKKRLRKALKTMNRETQMGLAAACHALANAKSPQKAFDPERLGVCFGAGNVAMRAEDFESGVAACRDEAQAVDISRWGEEGLPQVAPLWLLTCLPNMPACQIAIWTDLRGPNNTVTVAEASVNLALMQAVQWIEDGDADAALVGGAGHHVAPLSVVHGSAEIDLSPGGPEPSRVCRPFDVHRTGAVMAEGAAAMVIETFESAERRGAPIYGELCGFGSSCVLSARRVPDSKRAAINAMHALFAQCDAAPGNVGHFHAHAAASEWLDRHEAQAVREFFGARADVLPVTAAKSYFGNAGAGSSALELAASLLAMQHGRLFATLNCDAVDPECRVRPSRDGDAAGTSFLNLNLTPQGQASCALVRKAA